MQVGYGKQGIDKCWPQYKSAFQKYPCPHPTVSAFSNYHHLATLLNLEFIMGPISKADTVLKIMM